MIKTGDIIVFEGRGFLFRVLGRLLKWKRPDYDRWGWHTAIAIEHHNRKGWMIAEALAGGVQYSWLGGWSIMEDHRTYAATTLRRQFRIVSHFTRHIYATELRRAIADSIGCKYDVWAYLGTAWQILFGGGRWINNRYTCWEFVAHISRKLGKPIQPLMKYPNIADLMVKGEKK